MLNNLSIDYYNCSSIFFSDMSMGMQSKVCYVKFENSGDVGVALHLTNTVFIDRAIIVVPVADGKYSGVLFSATFKHRAVHKNSSVSGRPAGWLKKGATGDFIFAQFFFLQKRTILLWKKKKLRPPDWLQF